MTGVIYNCPNLSECLRNTRLNRMQALLLYFLNKGVKPEDIKVDGKPLQVSEILSQHSLLNPSDFTCNRDYLTRDNIIFGSSLQWEEICGGAKNFDRLTVEQLQQLVDLGFASPIEKQNFSPAICEFLTFGRIQKSRGFVFTFEGYVISPFREDYRVSIDGIVFNGMVSQELIDDFEAFITSPDELDIKPNYLRAWWD
ncbi:hypothetical protein F7734_18965 [Scytonema sp. UIC 10036]|nr:hypothetical protein [Scytonema sp. UIC 10036]